MTIRNPEAVEDAPARGKMGRAWVGDGYFVYCSPECCPSLKGARPRTGKGHGKHRTLRDKRNGR